MAERFTTDVPAVPDPDYVWVNPEYKRGIFERALEELSDDDSPLLRALAESDAKEKSEKKPKLYDYGPERVFVQTKAQAFIDAYAVYDDDGRLNLELTSANVGVPYRYMEIDHFAKGEIVGLRGSATEGQDREIHLDSREQLHHVTFGHEIGHYFLREVVGANQNGRAVENFCDFFGRRMAMPSESLEEYVNIDETTLVEIMSCFRADLSEVVRRLMEAGLMSPRVAIDTFNPKVPNEDFSEKVVRGVFCLHCMQVGGDYNCPEVTRPTPLLDFTDRAWSGRTQNCLGEKLRQPDIMSTLTKYYLANEVQLVLFRPTT